MIRRFVPRGLRAQLALVISLVAILATGVTFAALYRGTGARLRAQLDAQLQTQLQEWRHVRAAARPLTTPDALRRAGARFIADQSYHAESLIFVVQTSAGTITNDREVLAREARDAEHPLLTAPAGLTTGSVSEAGAMRILTTPVVAGGARLGYLRIAIPLSPVAQAQASLLRTFAFVGGVLLVLAALAGALIAGLLAAPLRRMARLARDIDAGDLSRRVGHIGHNDEVATLAEAFDRMLERLDRAFTRQRQFVSDASHELRTPLAVLRAQVELLAGERDPGRRSEGTRVLLRRVDELARLVDDMLTLASAEGGQLVEPRPIDLADFLEDLRRDLPLFGDRQFELAAVTGTLTADPERLTQVLRNLVRNAVTHTAPGGHIKITLRADGDRLEFTVSDDGPGIPSEELEHIFERFRRLDHGSLRDPGGAGLGLPIARAIVEAHGGTITAESAPGCGARFRLLLPGYTPETDRAAAVSGSIGPALGLNRK